jgi:hypothetical protein
MPSPQTVELMQDFFTNYALQQSHKNSHFLWYKNDNSCIFVQLKKCSKQLGIKKNI